MELGKLDTEKRNSKTTHIDMMSTIDMVTVINDEDHRCAEAVKAVLPDIARYAVMLQFQPKSFCDKLQFTGNRINN